MNTKQTDRVIFAFILFVWNILCVFTWMTRISVLYALTGHSVLSQKGSTTRIQNPAQFSLSSVKDATLPMLHPFVAAGSDRCEFLKSFLGLTYEQMLQDKAGPNLDLHIDYITKKGFISFQLNDTRINRVFRKEKTIIVLIHGFMESSEGMMVQALTPELLKMNGLALLALDGRNIISYEYFRSTTYVRFLGERLGTLLGEAIQNGLSASNITLIGHSLGAHIAGVAGKTVQQLTQQSLGRIAALDPAGPCFSNVSLAGRLDPSDARYIDVIHTSAGMLGLKEPLGHKDFYPNGGLTQNGCYFSPCDHTRSWMYFLESIMKPDNFQARKCDSWESFKEGKCSHNEVAYMGWDSEPGSNGNYYLTTEPGPPFGLKSNGSQYE